MGASGSKDSFTSLVQRLQETEVPPSEHEVWDELWKCSLSAEELFDVFTADDVRRIIQRQRGNIRTIFAQAVAQLYQVVETPYPVYFDQAVNCTRILARVMPFLLECDGDYSANSNTTTGGGAGASSATVAIRDMFWSRQAHHATTSLHVAAAGMGGSANGKSAGATSNSTDSAQDLEPLAVILVNSLFHLMFLPEFTIPDPNRDFNEADLNTPQFKSALMWAPGVGSVEKTIVMSTQYDGNRVDVLRAMLTTLSDSLFQSPDRYDSCASLWLEVATSVDTPYAEIAFYSLMNVVLGYDPIGWGIPYADAVTTDTSKAVMEQAIQVLIVLLDYGHPIRPRPNANGTDMYTNTGIRTVLPTDTETVGFNVFRRLLSSIESDDYLNFIFVGFSRLLNSIPKNESSYLPYSAATIEIEEELMILLWKCLEEIPAFLPYIIRNCDMTELVVPICYFMLQNRKDLSKLGLVYLCTFTLLRLSGERNFGVSMNRAFDMSTLPLRDIGSGITGACTLGDLVIISLHKIIVNGSDKLACLYQCFLTVICNVSPYCKHLTSMASMRLVSLLQLFASPAFLYASENNYTYLSLLIESMNNIVQYQYDGNVHMVYAIMRRKEVFEDLAKLSLPRAFKDIRGMVKRTKTIKGSRASGQNTSSTDGASLDTSNASNMDASSSSTAGSMAMESFHTKETESRTLSAKPTDLISTMAEVHEGIGGPSSVTSAPEHEEVSVVPAEERQAGDENQERGEEQRATSDGVLNAASRVAATADSDGVPPDENADDAVSGQVDAPGDSRAHFVPTEEWISRVRAELPLNTIIRLLASLTPLIQELSKNDAVLTETEVVSFLQTTTLVGLLPVPHPIVIRKYQPNRYTSLWFTAFMWGVVFTHNQLLELFDGRGIRLFLVQA